MNYLFSQQKLRKISTKILDSIVLLEVLTILVDGKAKEDTVISTIRKNLRFVFNELEKQ